MDIFVFNVIMKTLTAPSEVLAQSYGFHVVTREEFICTPFLLNFYKTGKILLFFLVLLYTNIEFMGWVGLKSKK